MASISNLEIFGAGVHNASTGKVTITEADLDAMVAAFTELPRTIVKPHLKLGHTDAQKWFGQKDGIPSLGWIEKVWRVGSKLMADIVDVPTALIDLIRQGRYHNVSAEVYQGIDLDGKKYSTVLSAVSLLGVEMPAVKDLAGLAASLFHTGQINQFSEKEPIELTMETFMFTQEQVDSLIAAAVAKVTSEVKVEFEASIGDLTTKVEVLEKAKDAAEAELETVKATAAQSEAIAIVDAAIKEGKLLPKQRDFAVAALGAKDTKIKFGKDEKSMSLMFKEFMDSMGKVIDTTELGSGKNKKVEYSNAADEVHQKALDLIAGDSSGKLAYAAAFDKVLKTEPDLKKQYADMSN
jgi:hypothetical protein